MPAAAPRPAARAALLLALLSACATAPPEPPLAFPGAEGAGRFALGGRGGRVYTVTQLGDAGPGSLREAVESPGPRTVVFAVGGTITLRSLLRVEHGRLTIAGQTAPGDGITLRGHPFEIAADDVVVRYLRSRLGDETGVDGDAIGIIAGRRIVLDHVSASWSTDEALSVSARFDTPQRSFDEITVQWSLIAEALNRSAVKAPQPHGFGTLLRAARGARVSFHHNLWAHHEDRMPRPGNWHRPAVDPLGGFFDFRNNVFYDWGRERAGYNLDRDTRSTYNFVANAYLAGPSSRGRFAFEESSSEARAWFEGNSMDGAVPADPWTLVRAHALHLPQGLPPGYRLPAPAELGPVRTDSAAVALQRVLAEAGASRVRDAVDARIVEQVRQRRGRIIDSQREVGGWPALRGGTAPRDSDGDGMSDDWERRHGLDPQDARDGARLRPGTPYTELEHALAASAALATDTNISATARPGPPMGWAVARVHPSLHLAGDSTMADKVLDPPNPERGWGMLLRELLRQPERVANHAANGRSTRNFISDGRWEHLLAELAPGDVVLLQFGHNDQKHDDPQRYAAPDSDYPAHLRRFIREVRERGATPLLATPVVRRQFDAQGRIQDTLAPYPEVVRRLARETDTPLIDLDALTRAWLEALGPEASKAQFMHLPPGAWARYPQGLADNTHYVEAGARAVARLALDELHRRHPPLREWLQ